MEAERALYTVAYIELEIGFSCLILRVESSCPIVDIGPLLRRQLVARLAAVAAISSYFSLPVKHVIFLNQRNEGHAPHFCALQNKKHANKFKQMRQLQTFPPQNVRNSF